MLSNGCDGTCGNVLPPGGGVPSATQYHVLHLNYAFTVPVILPILLNVAFIVKGYVFSECMAYFHIESFISESYCISKCNEQLSPCF